MVTAAKIRATLRKHGYDSRVDDDAMALSVGTGELARPESDEVLTELRSIVEPLGWQANWTGFDIRVTPAVPRHSTGDE